MKNQRFMIFMALLFVSFAVVFYSCAGGDGGEDGDPGPTVYKYFAYVTNYNSANVSAYTIDATTGALTEVTGSPFAAGDAPTSVAVDPSGKFAYVANLVGPNNVFAYTINATTGELTAIAGSPFAAGDEPNGVAVVRVEQ